jgi:hypothetical protein
MPAAAVKLAGALMFRLARFPAERGDATAELDMVVPKAAWDGNAGASCALQNQDGVRYKERQDV